MKKTLLILSLCFACTAAFGQPPAKLSRAQAVADIDTMAYYITTIHPDPFTIIPESDFRTGIERIKTSLPDSVKTLDLYLQLAPIVASLGDGHTSLQAPAPIFGWLDGARWFPLPLAVDPDTFEMTSEGRQVAQINGIPAAEIVRKVLATQSGESMAFRVVRVLWFGGWPVAVSLFDPAGRYRVVFADGETIEAAGVTFEEAVALTPEMGEKPDFTYRIIEDKNAAALEFNSLDNLDAFRPFLVSMFTDLKNRDIANLIIDMRENGGGSNSVGDELFQYISPVPFEQMSRGRVRISEPMRRLRPSIISPDFPKQDTIFEYPASWFELIPLRDNPLRFIGGDKKVFLLTSPITFSSAANFAWAFQAFNMGTIVGTETGGYIVQFGEMVSFRLPYSRMRLGISWKEFYGYGATEADRRPVRPDIEVPAAEALDYVLENLIK